MTVAGLRLWLRQFRADPWVVLALALLVLAAAFVMTGVPRLLSVASDRQLEDAVGSLSAYQREPVGTWTMPQPPTSMAQDNAGLWPLLLEGADRIREDQRPLLRNALQTPQILATAGPLLPSPPPEGSRFYEVEFQPVVSPSLTQVMSLTAGRWPAATYESPHEVVVSSDVAELVGFSVGDRLQDDFEIVGLVSAIHPDDPRWEYHDLGAQTGFEVDANRGEKALIWAYLAPDHTGSLVDYTVTQVRYTMWLPIVVEDIRGVDVIQLQSELTNLLARRAILLTAEESPTGTAVEVGFDSLLGPTLERVIAQQRATISLIAVVAAGPVGVAAAVVVLGAQLAVLRRRRTLDLALARGAAPEQLRFLSAIEAAVLTLPAAIIGHLLAVALLPGVSPMLQPVVTAVLAAAAPVALVVAVRHRDPRARRDLSRNGTRARWAAEIALVAVSMAATLQLLRRDGTPSASLDVLGAATPVLLALSACVLVMRLYPMPLSALAGWVRRGRGMTGFVGSSRALRDPAGGVWPTLAVVLGTTVAVLSTVLLSTVTRGTEVAMWTENGGDIRISGPRLTDDVVEQLRGVDGVAEVGRVTEAGSNRELIADGQITSVRIWVADDELAAVWQEPSISAPPPDFFDSPGPVIVTGGGTPPVDGPLALGVLGDAHSVGHLTTLPGSPTTRGDWILVRSSHWLAAGGSLPPSTLGLVQLNADADAALVQEQFREIIGAGMFTDVDSRLDAHLNSPVVQTLTIAFIAATALTSALTMAALVVVQLMGGPSRAELLAVLRTLGASSRQTRGIVAWELGPVLVVSLLVGALLGIGIGRLLVAGLDLSSLTGGTMAPRMFLDPWWLAGVLAAVVSAVALAILLSAHLAGRTNLAQALRIGEQR